MTCTIRARLTAWYSGVVVMVLVAGSVAVALAEARLGLGHLDEELSRLMLTLEGVMRTEFGEGLDLRGAADEASIEVVAPDRSLVVARPDGDVVAAWGQPLPAVWRPLVETSSPIETIAADERRFRAVHRLIEYKDHRYIAVVIASLDELNREQAQLWESLAIGVLVSLAVAVAGGWIVGRQTLHPLSDMARQATSISERDLSARLSTPHREDELGWLAAAFNAVLDRLAKALHAQRQFMADASHELRTPVSIIRTAAQVTLQRDARAESEYRESLAIVSDQSVRLTRLVDAMFLLSRGEAQGIAVGREHLYLDELVAESVRALRVLAAARSVAVRVEGDTEVAYWGDAALLRQMIGNLLDNAIRHARSGGTVTAALERTATGIVVRVTDDGDGVPPADRDRIFERFVRLDASSGGAGLGLPIARWVAEQHGGKLALENDASTAHFSTCFAATLPLLHAG